MEREDDVEELKRRLRTYSREQIEIRGVHFRERMEEREGDLKRVIENLLHPDKLVYSCSERGSYGDWKYALHFCISNTRTLVVPVIFDSRGRKNIFIVTYYMRHRRWHRKKGGKRR